MVGADIKAKLREAHAPGLDNAARLAESRLGIWRNCLLVLPARLGRLQASVETAAVSRSFAAGDGPLFGLRFANARQAFNIVVPEQLVEAAVSSVSGSVNIHVLDDEDLILVIEQALEEPLERIADLLGSYSELTGIERDLPAQAADGGFQFDVTIEGDGSVRCAVLFDDQLEARMIERIAPVSSADEKLVADALDVRIGPVVLSREDVAAIAVGQLIDCGVQPTDQIRGLLLRSDDRFWPGFIDDTGIRISGERQPLDFAKARQLDAVLLTLGFATSSLGPVERMKLHEGGFAGLVRHPDNFVTIHANDRAIGTGRLTVHDGNLCVMVESVGFGS